MARTDRGRKCGKQYSPIIGKYRFETSNKPQRSDEDINSSIAQRLANLNLTY